MEEWKFIKGYERRYQISSDGRVKSFYHNNEERMIAITDNGKGYKIVSLSKDGHRKNHYVHRLVAEHFLENPNNAKEVNHKDFNTSNNNVSNLEWCSREENMAYCRGKFFPKKTATGESYIQFRESGSYAVVIKHKETRFKTLPEAIEYRNKILKEKGFKIDRV